MKKSILLALMAITVAMLCTEDAFARCRQRCGVRRACCAAPACSNCNTCNVCSSCNAAPAYSACGASGCSACTTGLSAAPMVASATPAPMTVAQSNAGSNYQSFSYEPGPSQPAATVARIYAAPMAQYQAPRAKWNEFNSVLNGNRKAMGHRATGE